MANDRDLALRYLGDCLYGALLGQAGAVRPSDLVRSLPRGMRVGVGLIRQLMVDDERFEEMAGRFEIAARESLRKKPFGGSITAILEAAERPVPISLMTTALGRIRGASPQYFHELLDSYEQSRDDVVYAAGHVVHSDWLLLMEGEGEEQLLFYNMLDGDEDLKAAREECEKNDLRRRDPGLTAASILATLDRPLGPRALAFLTWLHHPQIFDPVAFVRQALERDEIVAAAGMWMGADYVSKLHEELRAASDELSGEGEDAPEVDIAEVLSRERPATPFKLDDADRSNVLAVVGSVQAPIGIDELIIDMLEISPEQRKFAAAVHTLDELLSDQPDLIRVSAGRYLSRAAVPEWVREIPRPLIPVETDFEEDAMLELDALPEGLLEEVLDPVYEDICSGVEIEPVEGMVPEERAECLLLHHHYVVGTLPVRSIDRKVFRSESDLSLLLMRHGDSEVYPVWLNSQLGLLFGLERWYHRYLPPSGAVFSVTPGDALDTFVLEYDGRTEAELCPEEGRMAVLESRRERVSHRPISIRYLMIELLRDHKDGLSFNALWAEMNAVRRTSRLQIASLLALYPCFVEAGGRWTLDLDAIDDPIDDRYAEHLVEPEEESEEEPAGE